jgi:hypothetical protein
MRVSIDVNVDIPRIMRKLNDDSFWTFAATEWWRLYSPYTPKQEGLLISTVDITPKQIEHTVPYAHYQYDHNLNHSENKNPLASCKWDKAAEPTQKPKLIAAMQGYIDSGRLHLAE